jgi:hypothetical protein
MRFATRWQIVESCWASLKRIGAGITRPFTST